MRYYPVFLDLVKKRCVVIGGGEVAVRKAEVLLKAGATVIVISPRLTRRLRELKAQGKIEHIARGYRTGDLKDAFLAIAATDRPQAQAAIKKEAEQAKTLVNVVDAPEACTFIVPSLVERGDVILAISTSGAAPSLARNLRERLEKEIGPEYEEFSQLLKQLRARLKKTEPDIVRRRQIISRVVRSPLFELIKSGRRLEAKKLLKELTGS